MPKRQLKTKRPSAIRSTGLVQTLPRDLADARIEALEEAAGHLELTWTDNDEERHQGHEVAHYLRKLAQQIFDKRQNAEVVSEVAVADSTKTSGGRTPLSLD